jgi:hypothetical protein
MSEWTKLYVFVDGSFAKQPRSSFTARHLGTTQTNSAQRRSRGSPSVLTSQLGFAIILANEEMRDEEGTFKITGNLIHSSSTTRNCRPS